MSSPGGLRSPSRSRARCEVAQRELALIDWLVDRAWDGGLAKVVGLVCIGFLIAWAPHYLTWPWSGDEDTYALLALSWDRGILPYRDIRTFNVPGEIYLFWGFGKVFGWGRTVPFYALDASCVVLLGVVVVAWSRRKLDRALPGLVGYLAFLAYYLNMTYETTGERDWHTAFLVCSGLMIAQAWPGRRSRIASALTTAMALTFRPHAVLFLPALAAAVLEAEPSSGLLRTRRLGSCWSGACGWAFSWPSFTLRWSRRGSPTIGFAAYVWPHTEGPTARLRRSVRSRHSWINSGTGGLTSPGCDIAVGNTSHGKMAPDGADVVAGMAGGVGLPATAPCGPRLPRASGKCGRLDHLGPGGFLADILALAATASTRGRGRATGLRARTRASLDVQSGHERTRGAGPHSRRDAGRSPARLPPLFQVSRPVGGVSCSPELPPPGNQPADFRRQRLEPLPVGVAQRSGRSILSPFRTDGGICWLSWIRIDLTPNSPEIF